MTTHRPARHPPGFTLLEVLVALTIMSLIMVALYEVLHTTLRTRDMLDADVRSAAVGPALLDRIQDDLQRIWALNLEDDPVLRGEDRTLLGEPADSLLFVASAASTGTRRVGERETGAELSETGYRLRINPELPDVLELWRRQDFHLDDEPLTDGHYELLHDRVVGFDVQYHEDLVLEHDALHDWDTVERHRLPAMVRVRLGLETGPRLAPEDRAATAIADRTRWYERLVVLEPTVELAMRIHPHPPSFDGALVDGGTGAGGEDDGEGEEDDDDPLGDNGPGNGKPDDNAGPGGSDDPPGGDEGDLSDLLKDLFGGGGS